MTECWLKPNWRPVATAMALPAVMLAGCAVGAVWAATTPLRGACVAGAVLSLVLLTGLSSLLRPRLSREGRWLLLRLQRGPALRVPLEHVEVFFFGQGPSMTGPRGGHDDEDHQPRTSNVVVRLAEAATELHRRDVEKRLGHWCDGYIVIRGTHCEPLSRDVLMELNKRLASCHRELRGQAAKPDAASSA